MSNDSQLYMRVRGRVLGPYDREKLQALSQRGQLSRMHEISSDGINWVRASNYPELFLAAPAERAIAPSRQTQLAGSSTPSVTISSPPTSAAPKWYYASGGAQQGPVEFGNLQVLAATGQLKADDMVWTDGMADWCPAREIASLLPQARHADTSPQATGIQSSTDGASLPESVIRAAVASRPWVLFIAISAFVLSALFLIGGFFGVIAGARARMTTMVAGGIFQFVYATIGTVGGFLLLGYASKLGALSHSATPVVLERALDAIRGWWVYLSILLIVFLAFVLMLVVLIFSEAVTLPGF